mmetsp:Transcript_26219/g.51718  ORF Transcript_26219/g.51718 Transcript_26219/m.51718 type:complete len:318 (+) Transcript_26219:932-1885(+)
MAHLLNLSYCPVFRFGNTLSEQSFPATPLQELLCLLVVGAGGWRQLHDRHTVVDVHRHTFAVRDTGCLGPMHRLRLWRGAQLGIRSKIEDSIGQEADQQVHCQVGSLFFLCRQRHQVVTAAGEIQEQRREVLLVSHQPGQALDEVFCHFRRSAESGFEQQWQKHWVANHARCSKILNICPLLLLGRGERHGSPQHQLIQRLEDGFAQCPVQHVLAKPSLHSLEEGRLVQLNLSGFLDPQESAHQLQQWGAGHNGGGVAVYHHQQTLQKVGSLGSGLCAGPVAPERLRREGRQHNQHLVCADNSPKRLVELSDCGVPF